ncbi:MAG: phosphate/phosphite/phosphonate ABC transporter substrate-binding protein [Thiohalophilus sp.]|jgi:phosphonate transport system substrate-binding protein
MKKLLLALLTLGVVMTGMPVQAASSNPDTLKVALLPDEDASSVIRQNRKFKEYLENKLDKEIELVVTTDYSSMIEAMRHKRIDLAYFGPLSYVLAKSRSDIEAFAAKTKNGSATYQSVVIGNVSKNINSISDMRGKNIAYGDQASTSSHMIPKSILVDNGLKPGNDYQEHFLGSHDAVAVAVQNGTADAGGLSKPIFESLVKRGIIDANKVRVITESKPFPQYPWAMRSDLDSGLKEKIKQTFYNLKDKEILKPMKADGLAPIADADYNVVRNLKKSLNL